MVSNSQSAGSKYRKLFQSYCDQLGIPLVSYKTIGLLTFMDIIVDTIVRELCLPQDKLDKCVQLIRTMLGRETTTLKQFQNRLEILNFACKAIVPRHPFLRRLYNKTTKANHPHHRIKVDDGAKMDLKMWLTFLGNHKEELSFYQRTHCLVILFTYTLMQLAHWALV